MVFIVELFLLSVAVMVGLFFVNRCLSDKAPLANLQTNLIRAWVAYTSKGLNSLYLSLLISLILLNMTALLYLVFPLLVVMTYFQPNVWALALEDRLINMQYAVRKVSLLNLLDDDCIITHANILKYIKDICKSDFLLFKEFIRLSVDDIRVAFGFYEPTETAYSEIEDLIKKYQHMFKYKKLTRDTSIDDMTDEEFLKFYAACKRNRDPNEMFNSLRRLPLKLVYEESTDIFVRFFLQHTVIFYNFFKTTILALALAIIYFIYTIFFFKIQFLKQLAVWFVIGMLYFWLMSGFNFFVKRYQYGKFTSQIQRFWKRTNNCFWLIEGFLLLLFFYYYLNSSQEPLYMYDYSAINQEFLIPLHVIFVNIVLLSLIVYFMYFVLIRINSNSWTQLNLYLILISVFIFFSFFLETYQFYYVISTFNERLWVFNEEDNLWMVDIDNPIFRTKHQYMFVCLIAKYWHFLFIFLSWVFFLIKSFERRKVTFVLFGANLQNMILLYALNLACYIQWFKWLYRRFFDLPYTWFFTNVDSKILFRITAEIKLLVLNFFEFNGDVTKLALITHKSLGIWNVDSLALWKFI